MRKAAADLNFEAAAELRDRMVELKKHLLEVENSLTGGAGSDDSGEAVPGDASASKNAVNMHDAVRSAERSAKRSRRKSSGRTERRTGK